MLVEQTEISIGCETQLRCLDVFRHIFWSDATVVTRILVGTE